MRAWFFLALVLSAATAAHAQPRPLPGEDGLPSRWPRQPQLDLARAAIGADLAWERFGVLGRGATICVVDTGIDLGHRDFLDVDRHTRVDWLLDLDGAPRGSFVSLESRFGGAIFDREAIDRLLQADPAALPTDWHGHGTAMASAALGDDAPEGVETPGTHAGVAPRARLIVVRALRRGALGFADPDVVRGVSFCETVSDPARTVVLLALGGHDGMHDGTEPLERALSAFVHRGLTIVVAAGNDSGRSFHAAARVPASGVERVTIHLPSPEDHANAQLVLAVRGAAHVALVAPDGTRTPAVVPGESVTVRAASAVLSVDASREGVLDVAIVGDAMTPLAGGNYVLEVHGAARFDAWIVHESLGGGLGRASLAGRSVVRGDEVTIPATAEGVIAVGSSVSRSFLARADGGPGFTLDADEEERAVFSAVGPSAGGAPRPDLLAPGGWIVLALSSQLAAGDVENLFRGDAAAIERHRQGADHVAVAGTSVSAALVAGALALAFEQGLADPARDRSLLAFTATRTSVPFTPRRGFGRLDVPAFLAARSGPRASARDLTLCATRAFVTPGADDLALVALATAEGGAVPSDQWVTFARRGEIVARAPLLAGIARARVSVGPASIGEDLAFSASIDGATATASVPVALDEDGSFAEPSGASGCSAGSGRGGAGCALLALVALHWVRARRRAISRRLFSA